MRKVEILLSLFFLDASYLCIFVSSLENIGGNLCNTQDDKVFVTELVQSVDATLFGFQDEIAAGEERFMVGNTKNGIRRGLLKFLVDNEESTFPPDAKVECTEIRLFVAQSDEERRTVSVPKVNIFRVSSDWTTTGKNQLQLHGLNGGSASTGDTTWKYSSYPSQEWKIKGGDFDEKELASKFEAGDLHWYGKTREMAEVVQGWINNSLSNYGFILVSSDEDGTVPPESYSRYSGIESSPELIPRLIVTYTSPWQGKPHRTYNDYIHVEVPHTALKLELAHNDIFIYVVCSAVAVLTCVAALTYIRRRSGTQKKSDEKNENIRTANEHGREPVPNDAEIL